MYFKFSFKRTLTSFKFFFCVIKTHIFDLIEFAPNKTRIIFMFFFLSTYLLFLCRSISSTSLLTIALLSCCLFNFSLFTGFLPLSLIGLMLSYLEPKSPRTFHLSGEFPGSWMRHVGLDLPFG